MKERARVRIEELRLVGFRAFENARLTLDDMTVLVGRNGAGKSTLLDAFDFLREAITDSLENALERRGGIQGVLHKGLGPKKRMAIAVQLRLDPSFWARRPLSKDSARIVDRKEDTPVVYGFALRQQAGNKGYVVEREEMTFPTGVTLFNHENRRAGSNGKARSTSTSLTAPLFDPADVEGAILGALREGTGTYRLAPSAIRAEPPIGPASVLLRDGANVGDVLKHVEKDEEDLAWVVKHLAAITPGIVGVQSGVAAGRRLVRFLQQAGKTTTRFDIGAMSDGTLRCLALLLALRQKPTPAVVAIDEIEDSVHPAGLSVLLDAVSASIDRAQILLTSHSPEALSHPAVTASRVRVIEWRDGKSEVFRLNAGAVEMSRPPRSVGKLLRTNALFTADSPERVTGDLFEVA